MATTPFIAERGLFTQLLGSSASLAIAAPLAEGDRDDTALTDATRLGWFWDRTTPGDERISYVIGGTSSVSITNFGLHFPDAAPASPANGDIWYDAADGFQLQHGGAPVPFGTVFTDTLKGLTPASGGGTTNFLRADGTWAAPAGTIGGSIATTQVAVGSGTNTIGGSAGLTYASGTLSTGVLQVAGGTAASPSLAFTASPDTGIYSPSVGALSVACGGIARVNVLATGDVTIGSATGTSLTVGTLVMKCTNAGNESVVIGQGMGADPAAGNNIIIGRNIGGTGGSFSNSIWIGNGGTIPTGQNSVIVGRPNSAVGSNCVVVGRLASAAAPDATALGYDTNASFAASVAIGRGAATTAANQFAAGSSSYPLNNVYFGKGVISAAPTTYLIRGTANSTVNGAGADIVVAGGLGNGTGLGGAIRLQTQPTGAGALTDRIVINADGRVDVAEALVTAASTTARTGLRIQPGVAPTTPTNGDAWETAAGLYLQIDGNTVGPINSLTLFSQTATATMTGTVDTTLVNAGVGSVTIPANYLTAGKKIRVVAVMVASRPTAAAFTSTLTITLGTWTQSLTTTSLTSVSGRPITLTAEFVPQATGASVTLVGQANILVGANGGGTTTGVTYAKTAAAFDTTAATTLALVGRTNQTNGTISCYSLTIESLF